MSNKQLDDDIRKMFSEIRNRQYGPVNETYSSKKLLLNEDESLNTEEGVPYTKNDALYTSSIDSLTQSFNADFDGISNPMIYYPSDNKVVINGIIPSLNDTHFEFRSKDPSGQGCFIWTDNNKIVLTRDNVTILNKVYGAFENWKNTIVGDIKPMSIKNR